MTLNARLATEMHATVLPVIDAHGRDKAAVAASIRTAFHTLVDLRTTQVAVIANRAGESIGGPAMAGLGDLGGVPVFAIPDVAAVSASTAAEVATRCVPPAYPAARRHTPATFCRWWSVARPYPHSSTICATARW